MLRLNLSRTIIILIGIFTKCDGYSNGAGTCDTGKAIGTNSFGSHGLTGEGSLEDGSLELSYDENTLLADNVFTKSRASVTLTSTSGASFKGFLIRLEDLSGNNLPSTTLIESSNEAELSSKCTANNVGGITHTSSALKTSVPFELDFAEPGNYLLEVTVVASRTSSGSNNWYYSSYNIKVENPNAETPSPTKATSPSPTTTMSPTTILTTTSPSPLPSASPTSLPSALPYAPSASPSNTGKKSTWTMTAITFMTLALGYTFW